MMDQIRAQRNKAQLMLSLKACSDIYLKACLEAGEVPADGRNFSMKVLNENGKADIILERQAQTLPLSTYLPRGVDLELGETYSFRGMLRGSLAGSGVTVHKGKVFTRGFIPSALHEVGHSLVFSARRGFGIPRHPHIPSRVVKECSEREHDVLSREVTVDTFIDHIEVQEHSANRVSREMLLRMQADGWNVLAGFEGGIREVDLLNQMALMTHVATISARMIKRSTDESEQKEIYSRALTRLGVSNRRVPNERN